MVKYWETVRYMHLIAITPDESKQTIGTGAKPDAVFIHIWHKEPCFPSIYVERRLVKYITVLWRLALTFAFR